MEYIIIGLISLLIWGAILQYIISSATKTKEREELDKVKIKLLAAIANKLGVDKEEILKALK